MSNLLSTPGIGEEAVHQVVKRGCALLEAAAPARGVGAQPVHVDQGGCRDERSEATRRTGQGQKADSHPYNH